MILHPAGRHHKGLGPPAGGSEVSHKGVTAAPCPEVHDYSIGLKSLARAARVRNRDNNNHTTYIFFLSPGGDFVATIDHVLVRDGFRFCERDLKNLISLPVTEPTRSAPDSSLLSPPLPPRRPRCPPSLTSPSLEGTLVGLVVAKFFGNCCGCRWWLVMVVC